MDDLAPLIRRIARGKHGAEHLRREEAREALCLVMQGADEMQVGALLIGLRMKGETAEELAGFTEAARGCIEGFAAGEVLEGAVDLPCYAGKRRAAGRHLVAAIRAAESGMKVVVHGVSGIPGRISAWQMLGHAGIGRAASLAEARQLLDERGIVYLDLADICPPLFALYGLRPRLGLRSFANSVARLLNPLRCAGQLNGIFHTPYAQLMAQANALLGQPRSLIFAGAEGEPELYADRQKVVVMQQGYDLTAWKLPDMGEAPYPREPLADLAILQDDHRRMLAGKLLPAEKAVCGRMQQALAWAADGEMPDTWSADRIRGGYDDKGSGAV